MSTSIKEADIAKFCIGYISTENVTICELVPNHLVEKDNKYVFVVRTTDYLNDYLFRNQ